MSNTSYLHEMPLDYDPRAVHKWSKKEEEEKEVEEEEREEEEGEKKEGKSGEQEVEE